MSKIIKVPVVLALEVPDDTKFVTLDVFGTFDSWVDKPAMGGQVWYMQDQYNPPRPVEIANWKDLILKV